MSDDDYDLESIVPEVPEVMNYYEGPFLNNNDKECASCARQKEHLAYINYGKI